MVSGHHIDAVLKATEHVEQQEVGAVDVAVLPWEKVGWEGGRQEGEGGGNARGGDRTGRRTGADQLGCQWSVHVANISIPHALHAPRPVPSLHPPHPFLLPPPSSSHPISLSPRSSCENRFTSNSMFLMSQSTGGSAAAAVALASFRYRSDMMGAVRG